LWLAVVCVRCGVLWLSFVLVCFLVITFVMIPGAVSVSALIAQFMDLFLENNNRNTNSPRATPPKCSIIRDTKHTPAHCSRSQYIPGYNIHVSMSALLGVLVAFYSWYYFGTVWYCVVQCYCTSSKIKYYPISVIWLHFLYYFSIRFVFGTVGTALESIDIHIIYNQKQPYTKPCNIDMVSCRAVDFLCLLIFC
jgi:hypothetical protein